MSQQFCMMINKYQFEEAIQFGKQHADFIRRDRWGNSGGGMVSRALHLLCGNPSQFSEQHDQMEDLVRVLLINLGGDAFINHSIKSVWLGYDVLNHAIFSENVPVVRALFQHSKCMDPCQSGAVNEAIRLGSSDEILQELLEESTGALWRIVLDDVELGEVLGDRKKRLITSARSRIFELGFTLILSLIGPNNNPSIQSSFLPRELVLIVVHYWSAKVV